MVLVRKGYKMCHFDGPLREKKKVRLIDSNPTFEQHETSSPTPIQELTG